MIVVATTSFNKDITGLRDKKLANKVFEVIHKLEEANSLSEISGIKKLSGASPAYRIRIGDYRLGFYFLRNRIQLTVLAHRKDIYKSFP